MASFETRQFCADDVFKMARIIRKIGLKKVGETLPMDAISSAIAADGTSDEPARQIGIEIVFGIADMMLESLDNIEDDLKAFLGSLSGIDDVGELPASEFVELIEEVFTSDGFVDFFTQAGKLANRMTRTS